MSRISLTILLSFFGLLAFSQQDINGQWKTSIQGLDLYLTIDSELYLTIPAQGILKEKADNYENSARQIDFYFKKYRATFVGTLANDTLAGTWTQSGRAMELDFVRSEESIEITRTQEPLAEITYLEEEVTFKSVGEDEFVLSGTITMPKGDGPFPAIVLVSGSGPQLRDSDIFNHKPFLILADYFSRRGYMVLRYDDRGVGKSKGYFAKATSMDFADDTEGAIEYLMTREDVAKDKVGIMGHSEGGLIAPIVASRNTNVDYIVLLAGPGQEISDLFEYQLNSSYETRSGFSEESLKKARRYNKETIKLLGQDLPNDKVVDEYRQLTTAFYLSLSPEEQKMLAPDEQKFYFAMAPSMLTKWMRYFLGFKPHDYLTKVTVPTLALNGKKDVQVLWKENIKAIKTAYKESGNKQLKVKTYKNLNHLFQTSETGAGSEYFTNSETFNEEAMKDVWKWLEALDN